MAKKNVNTGQWLDDYLVGSPLERPKPAEPEPPKPIPPSEEGGPMGQVGPQSGQFAEKIPAYVVLALRKYKKALVMYGRLEDKIADLSEQQDEYKATISDLGPTMAEELARLDREIVNVDGTFYKVVQKYSRGQTRWKYEQVVKALVMKVEEYSLLLGKWVARLTRDLMDEPENQTPVPAKEWMDIDVAAVPTKKPEKKRVAAKKEAVETDAAETEEIGRKVASDLATWADEVAALGAEIDELVKNLM